MKFLWVVLFALGCSKEAATPPAPKPVPAPAAADAAATVCSIDGTYRLRFHSNGADGWWLRLRVDKAKAEVTEKQEMLGLERGPIDTSVDPKTCELKLTKETKQAGKLEIAVVVDPATGAATGELTRSAGADDKAPPPSPIGGLRETFQFMEDGEAGENLWACAAKHAEITGTRIAD